MSLIKLGRYDLTRVLGKGAMGLVYEGRDPNLNRRVAIKTIKVDNLSDQAADEYEVRFRTEAHSAARLQHPNIVSVYDSDRDGDIAFLVLEFVEGNDLKHHLDSGEVFSLAQTLSIMSDLLSALAYAHKQNIVHRDVKPANLLVQASGRIKLADFGVARIQDSGDATRTQGSIVGTLKYMSPEQLEGRPIDARADLFAAGVVLYQLLTSKRPFDGETDFAVIQNIVGLTPPAVTFHNAGLPAALDAVVAKALAKSRDVRFASADEFVDALNLASNDAADATIAPKSLSPVKGVNATWTGTMMAGESLIATRAGLSTGSGTSANGTLLTQEVELVYWKDIRESDDVPDLQRFLLKFPEGIYADLARRKLKLLGVVPVSEAQNPATAEPVVVRNMPSIPPPRAKAASAPASRSRPNAAIAPVAAKKTSLLVWALLGLVAVAMAVIALKMVPASNPSPAIAGAASAPLSAASAASAALGLGPGETAVVSFGADVPGARPGPMVAESAASSISAASAVVVTAAASTATASVGAPLSPASVAASAGVKASLTPASSAQRQVAAVARAASAASKRAASGAPGPAQEGLPVSANSPESQAPKPKTAAPVAAASGGPNAACEGRVLFGFQICMSEQCAKPAFAQQSVCVERRQMDERRRDGERSR
jgi:eukaryotic-like serine/threonine-protein kinase